MKKIMFFLTFWLYWGMNAQTVKFFHADPGINDYRTAAARPASRDVEALDSINIVLATNGNVANQLLWEYDSLGNVLVDQSVEFNDGQPNDGRRVVTQYADYHVPTFKQRYYYDNGWQNDWRQTYYNNANQQADSVVRESYNGTSWELDKKYIYTYTGDLLTYTLTQSYENNSWMDSEKEYFTYNADDKIIEYRSEVYNNGQWENHTKRTWTYNANGDPTEAVKYSWDNGAWVYANRKLYDYNNNLPIRITRQNYDNGSWVNDTKDEYTYDNNNDVITEIDYVWDNGQWNYDVKLTFSHDVSVSYDDLLLPVDELDINFPEVFFQHQITGGDIYVYYSSIQSWVRVADMRFYYSHRTLSDKPVVTASGDISVYPNPAKDILYIRNQGEEKITGVELHMINGRRIKAWKGEGLTNISLKDIPAGMYILIIETGQHRLVQKLIKR